MSTGVDSKAYRDSPEVEANGISQVEHAYDLDEKAKMSEYKTDAIEAENAEHNIGVLEAVRAYPMASFWAFIMSFTVVKLPPPFPPSS
jgi:SP family general alpha glucoside:H+ symporter-like MFS transporter